VDNKDTYIVVRRPYWHTSVRDLLVDELMHSKKLEKGRRGELLGRAEEADAVVMHGTKEGLYQRYIEIFPVDTAALH